MGASVVGRADGGGESRNGLLVVDGIVAAGE